MVVAFIGTGCQVTEEKLELWKSTKKGPKKLAGVVIDPDMEMELRAKAGLALIDIKEHMLLKKAFTKIESDVGDEVIAAAAPMLLELITSETPGSLDTSQVKAKDGLYLLYDFAGEKSKKIVEQALVKWCTEGNFKSRERAGFSVHLIVKKVGTPVVKGLAGMLTIDEPHIQRIAGAISESEDEEGISEASSFIAKQLLENVGKFSESHLMAAAKVGGESVGDALVKLATDKEVGEELRRYALRAYSVAIEQGNIEGTASQASKLISMAEDAEYDKYHREETYMTIAQIDKPQSHPPLMKLLRQKEFFWRLVGLRCLLRLDGEKYLLDALKTKKLSRNKKETEEIISLIGRFPELKDKIVEITGAGHAFAKGVAIGVLGHLGDKDDIEKLKKLENSKQKLPRVFKSRTVGSAAKATVKEMEKKG